MRFDWLIPDRLKLFLLATFWSFELNALVFRIRYAIAYNESYLSTIGESLFSALIIYIVICVMFALHSKLCARAKLYEAFWAPQKSKLVLTVILTIVSITSYVLLVGLGEKTGLYYPALFFVAASLNVIPSFYASGGYEEGILKLENFLSTSGVQVDAGPLVYHTNYLFILPMILSALVWNYFISCLVFLVISRLKK